MRVAVKRADEHGQRAIHLVDGPTGRGLLLHYDEDGNGWEWVKPSDLPMEGIGGYLCDNNYMPREVPKEEFDGLYAKVNSSEIKVLEVAFGSLNPDETPTIRGLVDERHADYIVKGLEGLAVMLKQAREQAN